VIKFPRNLAAAALVLQGAQAFAIRPEGPSVANPAGTAAPRSEAPRLAVPYGLIWLDVDPGPAEVSLDGDFLDAGVWLISVSPGEHDLRVRKTGFRGYAGHIAVPAGGSVHLDVRLQPGAAGDS
jgi:hypothetical protein